MFICSLAQTPWDNFKMKAFIQQKKSLEKRLALEREKLINVLGAATTLAAASHCMHWSWLEDDHQKTLLNYGAVNCRISEIWSSETLSLKKYSKSFTNNTKSVWIVLKIITNSTNMILNVKGGYRCVKHKLTLLARQMKLVYGFNMHNIVLTAKHVEMSNSP